MWQKYRSFFFLHSGCTVLHFHQQLGNFLLLHILTTRDDVTLKDVLILTDEQWCLTVLYLPKDSLSS